MTIDEAIKWQEDCVEGFNRLKKVRAVTEDEIYCNQMHRQLTEWLKDLKSYKEMGPCELCCYNPPSSGDGKPCSICPATPRKNLEDLEPQPKTGHWLRMSDLSEQEDDRYQCSRCRNVVHYTNKMNLYTFNSWCGRCGSDNGRRD